MIFKTVTQRMWWRRRESNPGPEKVSLGFYMLILSFESDGKITGRQVFHRSPE